MGFETMDIKGDMKKVAKAGAKKVGKTLATPVTAPIKGIKKLANRKKSTTTNLEDADCGKASIARAVPVLILDLEDVDLDQLEY